MMMRVYFPPFFVVFSEFYEQKIQHILYVHRNSMTQKISYKDPNSTSLVRTREQYDIKSFQDPHSKILNVHRNT